MSWTDGFKCDWCGKITLSENSKIGEFVKMPGIIKTNDGREKHRYAPFCNHYYFTSEGEPKIFCSAKCKHESGDRDEWETPEQARDRLNKDFDGLQPLDWVAHKVEQSKQVEAEATKVVIIVAGLIALFILVLQGLSKT